MKRSEIKISVTSLEEAEKKAYEALKGKSGLINNYYKDDVHIGYKVIPAEKNSDNQIKIFIKKCY